MSRKPTDAEAATSDGVSVPGRRDVLTGAAIVIAAGVILSLGIFAIRGARGSDAWQYLFWRGIGLTAATMLLARVLRGQSPLLLVGRMGRAGWLAALCMAISQITFISAIKLTTVAETFILCALAPLIAAAAAWPLFGERITAGIAAAIALGVAGVIVMSGGALEGGGWWGRSLAFVSAAAFAGYTLSVRRAGAEDLAGSLIAVGWLTVIASAAALVVTGLPWTSSVGDAAIGVTHGAVILMVGLYLFGIGARTLSGVTLTLLAQTETVLSPLWGTFVFGEPLTRGMIVGGLMVIGAIGLQTWANVGARSAKRTSSGAPHPP